MNNTVLKVDNVSMKFNLMEKKVDNLKEFFIKMLKNELRFQEFWALHNISFSLERGDRIGILGLNGAGKSTLLKIIAGVLKATEGRVVVKGKIVPLLELGAGFDPQYTGQENIYLYGALLGYPKDFIREKFDEIVEFSELGDFIHVPVKNYSSGMKARLGFSIATVVEPDILILDEVLSVGDAKFRKKSEKRIHEMFDQGVTVLFVSHSIEQVRRVCNRAIILEHGKLIEDGPVKEVTKVYANMIGEPIKKKKKKKKKKVIPVEEIADNTNTSLEKGVLEDAPMAEKKIETSNTETETVSTEVETASTEVETASTETETTSTEVETASTEIETSSTETETASTEVETASTETETASTEKEMAVNQDPILGTVEGTPENGIK